MNRLFLQRSFLTIILVSCFLLVPQFLSATPLTFSVEISGVHKYEGAKDVPFDSGEQASITAEDIDPVVFNEIDMSSLGDIYQAMFALLEQGQRDYDWIREIGGNTYYGFLTPLEQGSNFVGFGSLIEVTPATAETVNPINISLNVLGIANLDTRYNYIAAITFNDKDNQPVPEPSTILLLGTGLIGLAGWGRKKFKKN